LAKAKDGAHWRGFSGFGLAYVGWALMRYLKIWPFVTGLFQARYDVRLCLDFEVPAVVWASDPAHNRASGKFNK
jgi:hypothetical protein